MLLGEHIAAAALGMLGVPFRLRGRSTETGVDCVGLVLLSLAGAGWPVREPPGYQLRGTARARAEAMLRGGGLVPVKAAEAGDIILAESGPMQLHLMVRGESGHIQAHAGLGRVVLMPLFAASLPPMALIGIWRASPPINLE